MKRIVKIAALSAMCIAALSCNIINLDAFFGNKEQPVNPDTGIPTDKTASETEAPVVTDEQKTFNMPASISPLSVDPDNAKVGRFSLAGINANGEWLELHGTMEENQNVWLKINGVEKGVKVYNGTEVVTRAVSKAKASPTSQG